MNHLHTELKPITSDQLPSPKGKWLTGHLDQFKAVNKHQVMERWVEEVGDIFQISLLGKKFIISADADINKEILRQRPHNFRRFHKIDEILQEMGILGVFNAEGDTWRNHRKITSEALNLNNVRGFFPTISNVSDRLISKWKRLAQENTTIEVQQEMMRYTVDITTEIAFGHQMNTLEKEDEAIQQHLEKIFPMVNARITAPLPLWRLYKTRKDQEFDHALDEVKKAVHTLIVKSKQRLTDHPEIKTHPNNFLEALLVQQANEGKFTDEEIFGNVFTMLLAGEDTTSNTISWTLFFLAQNPIMVQKIRSEMQTVLNSSDEKLSFNHLALLKYTEAVCMESMRLKPVTPNLYMQALKDVQIDNYLFRKGETIMMQNKVPQTKASNFSKPNAFIPERWLSIEGCPMHTGAHSPDLMRSFGGGSRFCPGKGLAMTEMVTAVAMICQNFNLTLAVKPEEVKDIFAFTMYPSNLLINLKSIAPITM